MTRSSKKIEAAAAAAAPREGAKVERILDERCGIGKNGTDSGKKKHKHAYLCALTTDDDDDDGGGGGDDDDRKEEPQWVASTYVRGTLALEEWEKNPGRGQASEEWHNEWRNKKQEGEE